MYIISIEMEIKILSFNTLSKLEYNSYENEKYLAYL